MIATKPRRDFEVLLRVTTEVTLTVNARTPEEAETYAEQQLEEDGTIPGSILEISTEDVTALEETNDDATGTF